jgi:hypothetical protein
MKLKYPTPILPKREGENRVFPPLGGEIKGGVLV